MRLTKHRIFYCFVVGLAAQVVGACSSNTDGDGTSPTTLPSTSSDAAALTVRDQSADSYAAADAVPLSLLDPEFLARLGAELRPTLAPGEYEPAEPFADELSKASQRLEASGRASREMNELREAVEVVFDKTFSKSGLFRGELLTFSEGQRERRFVTRSTAEGAPRFIAVRRRESGAAYRYRVEVYTDESAADSETLVARTVVDFSPVGEGDVDVRVEHAQPTATGTHRMTASYRRSKDAILTTFGDEPSPATMPVLTVLRFTAGDETSSTETAGGYVWGDYPQPDNAVFASYYAPRAGDTEIFATRTGNSEAEEAAQLGAFVTAAEMQDLDYKPDSSVFDVHPYTDAMKLLANPQLLYTKNGARLLVQAGERPLAAHAKLITEVESVELPDLSRLADPKWDTLPVRRTSEFADAEPLPIAAPQP